MEHDFLVGGETVPGRVNPAYAQGPLVRVATGRQQPEAEMIQGMLLEEGIPSTVKRSAGFDVPDMLAAGPRDILVAASGAGAAREVLLGSDLIDPRAGSTPIVRPQQLLIGLLVAVLVVILVLVIGSAMS
jgi:hypothetical protein